MLEFLQSLDFARRGPQWVSALLVTAILLEVGHTAWVMTRGTPGVAVGSVPAPALVRRDRDFSDLVNAHLFGMLEVPAAAVAHDPPDSQGDLTLSATFAAADPVSGYAIIASSAHGPVLYSVRGAHAVETGVDLAEVYPDRVVVLRSGTPETLWLTRRTARSAAVRSGPLNLVRDQDERKRYGNAIKLEQGGFDPEKPAAPSPTRVITQLGVMPVIMGDHLFGYSVDPKVAGAIKGLPPNAVVTKINGVLLDAGPTAQRMFESLSDAGTATMSVRSGDSDSDIQVDVSGLPAAVAPRKKPAG